VVGRLESTALGLIIAAVSPVVVAVVMVMVGSLLMEWIMLFLGLSKMLVTVSIRLRLPEPLPWIVVIVQDLEAPGGSMDLRNLLMNLMMNIRLLLELMGGELLVVRHLLVVLVVLLRWLIGVLLRGYVEVLLATLLLNYVRRPHVRRNVHHFM
jgi:hypothetical protein